MQKGVESLAEATFGCACDLYQKRFKRMIRYAENHNK